MASEKRFEDAYAASNVLRGALTGRDIDGEFDFIDAAERVADRFGA
jgi:hypothetical protein